MGLRSCDPFDIPVPGDLPTALARVRASIEAEGGRFSGDAASGRFEGTTPVGTVEGNYMVAGNVVRVTITSKPIVAPCGAIEARVRKYFA